MDEDLDAGLTYVLVPAEDAPGENVAVFADGSWEWWTPGDTFD